MTSCLEGFLQHTVYFSQLLSTLSELGKLSDGRDFRTLEKQGGIVAGKVGWRMGSRSQKGERMLYSWF